MGSSVYTYIGPIIRIALQKVSYAVDKECCINDKCVRFKVESKDRFCKECAKDVLLNISKYLEPRTYSRKVRTAEMCELTTETKFGKGHG